VQVQAEADGRGVLEMQRHWKVFRLMTTAPNKVTGRAEKGPE
jgi:hypothetical protein